MMMMMMMIDLLTNDNINNNNIIVTTSDKGRSVIMVDSTQYNKKMTELLSDKNTYKQMTQQTIGKI